MRLLVTRPHEDAVSFAELLRARGHIPIVAPIMDVRPHDGPPIALEGVQALLATSANGVRALALRTRKRNVALYAVGPQTAEAAKSAGFKTVHSAEGDSTALVEFVADRADPAKGLLLHAAGAETAGRLRQALQAKGFKVETMVLYDAVPASELPDTAKDALRDGSLDGALLFSPRSAKTFATLTTEAKLEASCGRLDAFCISPATAAALSPLSFARVSVAGAPNQDAMLALIPPLAPGS
jgi:uroporphyrinogen-III synthase